VEFVSTKMFDCLIDLDFDGNPLPSLARSWDVSDDGKRYTFHQRQNASWHDGKDLTSADVAYSMMLLKEVNPRRRVSFANLVEVETPEAHTATMVFSQPTPALFAALGTEWGAPVVPKHLYEGTDIASNPNQTAPVGSGPYMFKEWVRGSHIVLDRNPHYWDEGNPKIERLVLRFIPDSAARSAALESGELDLGAPPLADVARLSAMPHLAAELNQGRVGGRANQIFFNLETPVLQAREVRLAIAHALNYDQIVNGAWQGYARPSPTVIGPSMPAYHDADLKFYDFDPAKAEALLEEAGKPRGESDKRFPLRILFSPFHDTIKRVAEVVRSNLIDVGIDARIESYDHVTYIRKIYTERAFDLDIGTIAHGSDPSEGTQRSYWSKNFKPGVPLTNGSGYANARVDELFEMGAVEMDPAKRREIYVELQRIIHEDLPSINLVSQETISIYNKRLHGHASSASLNFASAFLA
jgi:peptide/nickel transport system substrate-binding protein